MIRIGLIEDNIEYRDNLAFFLGREGFDIAFESDGHAIDYLLALHPCDVILLDLGLPDEDGLAIARRLRAQQPSLGIVMVTARGSLDERLSGMREGADAYLVKPVDFRELMAVLKSLLRRLGIREQSAVWVLQVPQLQLVSPGGLPIKLTGREAKLLGHMARAHPMAASRQSLAASDDARVDPLEFRSIEVALSRLRKKIHDATGQQLILASRSEGYLFGAALRLDGDPA
ncbi:MAG TPA: response regulator transcription factor [Rhodoferax sp.]|jgi:DNA-binding response OmpR family regulator|nr:response regulator transcription factor [Rhodoferax sp.]HNV58634.1 response regulator transcription factor [Rhodoferax sp.]HPW28841.1 response regulator transcription factor [Rhodoferax sp.]